MSDAIRESIAAILAAQRIEYSIQWAGQRGGQSATGDEWHHDEWAAQFVKRDEKGDIREAFGLPFRTGLGLRADPSPVDVARLRQRYGKRAERSAEWQAARKPRKPHAADVLSAVILDSRAADMAFWAWCADFGYSDDSIKARTLYDECARFGVRANRFFGMATMRQLSETLADY